MFEKDEILQSFKNKRCKIWIKIYRPSGDIYILYRDLTKNIRLYTSCSIADFGRVFWQQTPFLKSLDALLENVMFVNFKHRFPFSRRKVYTIKKNIEQYVNVIKLGIL